MFKSITRLVLITTALTVAIIPSVASARPARTDQPYSDAAAAVHALAPPATQHASAPPASGFSWQDAGIGAFGMLVLLGAGAGTALAVRRRTILN